MENTPKITTKSLFAQDNVRAKFEEMLGKRATQFITSVLQVASQNEKLAKADPMSIYNAAAVAATLDLPLNNNLGFSYIVPYNNSQPDGSTKVVAQFQIGYKGFIQLAQRSGQFKTISATPIFEGQIKSYNRLTGIEFDFSNTSSDKVVGYAAYFSLINGFEKTFFMTVDELKKHGLRFSKTFNNKNSLWQNDFDSMAQKTVLKLLLSKYAPLSVEMQKAVITDQSYVKDAETEDVEYIDNEPAMIDSREVDKAKEYTRITDHINNSKTLEQLKQISKDELLDELQSKLYEDKEKEFSKG